MEQQDPVYITGHQHPDTDSVASAIAYALFKRAMGVKAIPCRLGKLSNETKYLLKRFGFEEPMLLEDARKKLKEINLDSPEAISPETTVYETIRLMHETERSAFAVTDHEKKVIGFVSKSDLAKIGLGDTAVGIDLLQQTSTEDIAKTISGRIIYDDPETHLNGKVSIIAMTKSGTDNYEIKDRIVIVGNDPVSERKLIQKGAGMLIVVWAEEIESEVLEEAKKYHCPVIISGHGSMNTSRYIFFAAEEAGAKMAKTRFRSYPVIDEEDHLVGYVTRSHIMEYRNKKIILVDHNEFSQSVRAVEKAQILEVVDHHRINDFATTQPVSFRNEIVGSTATIIATMFRENQIPIPRELAGLMLGAILSDTLIFQSPTTTKKDIDTANILAALADLDIDQFGREMFSASAANMNQSIHEMIVQDIKYYDISGCSSMISQCMVASINDVKGREKEIQEAIDRLVKQKGLDLLVVAFTSIADEGSIFFSAGEKGEKCQEAFPDHSEGGHDLQKGIFSRKSQILPALTRAISE